MGLVILFGIAVVLAAATQAELSGTRRMALVSELSVPPVPAWEGVAERVAETWLGAAVLADATPLAATAVPTLALPTPIAVIRSMAGPRMPGQPRALTTDGCCSRAWWRTDSQAVRYMDRAPGDPAPSILEIPVWPPGQHARHYDAQRREPAGSSVAMRRTDDLAIVRDEATGTEWSAATGAHPVLMAESGERIVWWEARGDVTHHAAAIAIHTATRAGARQTLGHLWGASVIAFMPDDLTVLVAGRTERASPDYMLGLLHTESGTLIELARGSMLSGAVLAPGGAWVAYMVSLDSRDPAQNGLWAVPTTGGLPRRLPFIGAYRWLDAARLLYVPSVMDAPVDELWAYDVAAETARLVVGESAAIRIADNDWSVSPDGRSVLYRSATDANLWVVDLPED